MAGRYPEIEPYEHGMLGVGDGHLVYWEACGNPRGIRTPVTRAATSPATPPRTCWRTWSCSAGT